jgi:hypothetical protein
MTNEQIWNCETSVADLLCIDIPDWIESDIAASTIASIVQGGCNSGAYMPAVTYQIAVREMAQHGDDVLDYILDYMGDIPPPDKNENWSGMACFYLSYAVELWAGDILCQLESLKLEGEGE